MEPFVILHFTKQKKICVTSAFYGKLRDNIICQLEEKYKIIKFARFHKESKIIKYRLQFSDEFAHLEGMYCEELLDAINQEFFKNFILFVANTIKTPYEKNIFKFRILEKTNT